MKQRETGPGVINMTIIFGVLWGLSALATWIVAKWVGVAVWP